MPSYDDSTGKSKITEAKTRYTALATFFAIGLCLGIVLSERVYVQKRAMIPKPRQLVSRIANSMHVGHHAAVAEPRNELEAFLMKIAPQKEVLLAVANKNTMWDGMLDTFTQGFKRAKVPNHMVLALDQETLSWCQQNGINAFMMNVSIAASQKGTGDNHAVSALKFGILRKFVELGWAVLLSDVDIAIFQNPFEHLYRDSDVEGMTDGFDEHLAYGSIEGFDDPSMGWGRYAQYYKHFNLNSGLFYIQANNRTLDLLTRLETRLSKEKYWDQTAYNEEIFFLSHGSYKSPQVSVRVMEIDKFMNSKRLFKDIRHRPKEQRPPLPVMVHINYHPDKHERLKAVIQYYAGGNEHALDPFPGGSEAGTR
ncbi:hypothetical protein PLESTB_001087700 [Pleodorina starrii]|uniref:Nucleotide-diphospho-sugar transferase domain-containing protein n=1 Tax=Pleodorina starrii TaxID=330485 RepID=A0A9W6F594_9CHLO|nr:hypothetical protein PLESTM_000698600 [Pleodorina starrii]GLC56280.1 hypothetical protein PLESTB_001087700 [Pleodorina starrii]GLC69624.1 hypothetical protein PLESTF_000856100 [Pleodorina starrii]